MGIVSSNRKISLSLITTMSSRAEESRVSVGIVAGELSLDHWFGRSANSLSPDLRCFFSPLASIFRAQSCLQVYLPFFRTSGQFERMWWTVAK